MNEQVETQPNKTLKTVTVNDLAPASEQEQRPTIKVFIRAKNEFTPLFEQITPEFKRLNELQQQANDQAERIANLLELTLKRSIELVDGTADFAE